MAAAGAFSGVGASGVQCDKMSNAWLGAGGRTRRGQDSVSAHFELAFFLSFFPPPTFQPARQCSPRVTACFLFFFFLFSCRPLPPSLLPPFHIFIALLPLSISPLCVGEGVSRGPHSVSRSRSINDRLEHHPHLPRPPHPPTPAHTRTFQLFLPPLKTSQHFFIYSPFPFSLSLYLSPRWRDLPRLITRSPNQRCMASPVMSVGEEEWEREEEQVRLADAWDTQHWTGSLWSDLHFIYTVLLFFSESSLFCEGGWGWGFSLR